MEIESGVDLVDRSSPEKRSQPEEGGSPGSPNLVDDGQSP